MSILLKSKTVRVPLNLGSYDAFNDDLTKGPVVFPIADLRFEIALLYGQVGAALQLVDLSNIVSLSCTVKAMGAGGVAPLPAAANLMQKVVLAEDFFPGMTMEQWKALTHCHAAFDFDEAEVNNITTLGAVWVIFTALLDTGKVIPIKFGSMTAVQDGYASAGTTGPSLGTAYTKEESLALFAKDRNDITGRIGGAAGDLDGIVTAAGAWATGQTIRTLNGALNGRAEWILKVPPEDAVEDADNGVVFPDDHDPETNNRAWFQIL